MSLDRSGREKEATVVLGMAKPLYKLGSFAYRRKWFVTLVGLEVSAVNLEKNTSPEIAAPANTAAPDIRGRVNAAFQLPGLDERFLPESGQSFGPSLANFVFKASPGRSLADPRNLKTIGLVVTQLRGLSPKYKLDSPEHLVNPVAALTASMNARATPSLAVLAPAALLGPRFRLK